MKSNSRPIFLTTCPMSLASRTDVDRDLDHILTRVSIHGQFLREDQIDAFNRLGVLPSLFPMHTYYWEV